jgi:OPA family hexose phosphate transport protein UhpT-like MFS transporter
MKLLQQVRLPTLDLPVATRRKMWSSAFLKSYLVVFFAYLAMYLIRKNYNVSQNDLIEQYGFTKTQLGQIGAGFAILYGIGKTVVGYHADKTNTKNFVCILLILSALSMFGFGAVSGSFYGMIFFYALNGLFQSAGGPASYSTITKWSDNKRRGTFLGMWNWSHNVGGAMAAFVATYGAQQFFNGDVRGMFLFPACIALAIGLIGLFFGSDSPESYGLGKAEEIFNEKPSLEEVEAQEQKYTQWQIFKKYVLANPVIWVLCFANVFTYIVRIGCDQWGVVYAKEVIGLSKEAAKQGFTIFEIGAFFGSISWGIFSDLIKGRRGLAATLSCIFVVFLLMEYQSARTEWEYKASMFGLGFLIYGPQLLVLVSTTGFVPKAGVSVVNGFNGTFAYLLGDLFAKVGMGMMADNKNVFGLTGWSGTFTAMYLAAFAGIATMAYVAIKEERKIRALARNA